MDEGLARLESTAARLESDEPSPMRARIMASIAGAHMLRGDHARAMATAEAAIEVARATNARLSEAHALNTLGTSTALTGDCSGGLPYLREAFAVARELNDVDDIGRGYANLSSVLTICGMAEESYDVAMEGVAWARTVGAGAGYGRFIAGNAVDAATEMGRWDEAEEMVDELMAGDAEGVNRLGMIAVVGPLYARRGRAADAQRMLEEGRAQVDRLLEAQFTGPMYVGLVEFALAAGRTEATAIAAEGIAQLGRTGDRYYQTELLSIATRAEADRAETARAGRDDATAREAVSAAAAFREQLGVWLAESSGQGQFGGLLAADEAMSAAELRRAEGTPDPSAWKAAVLAADRAGYAWRKAYARYRLAEAMLLARAPRRDAAAALREAWASADALSARPLVGWIEALARRSRVEIPALDLASETAPAEPPADDHGLTAREREVLALLIEGHTNKRIAEELFISESTAGVHVSNILGKLGVATRTEAATVAARLGLVE